MNKKNIIIAVIAVLLLLSSCGKAPVEQSTQTTAINTPTPTEFVAGQGIPKGALGEVVYYIRLGEMENSMIFLEDNEYTAEVSDEQWQSIKDEVVLFLDGYCIDYFEDMSLTDNSMNVMIDHARDVYGDLVGDEYFTELKSRVDEGYDARVLMRKDFIIALCDEKITPALAHDIKLQKTYEEIRLYIQNVIADYEMTETFDGGEALSNESYEIVSEKYGDCLEFLSDIEAVGIFELMDGYDAVLAEYPDLEDEIADAMLVFKFRLDIMPISSTITIEETYNKVIVYLSDEDIDSLSDIYDIFK